MPRCLLMGWISVMLVCQCAFGGPHEPQWLSGTGTFGSHCRRLMIGRRFLRNGRSSSPIDAWLWARTTWLSRTHSVSPVPITRLERSVRRIGWLSASGRTLHISSRSS